jgi:hypothetical protein
MVKARRISRYERRELHRMKRQQTNQVNSSHARVTLLSSGRGSNGEITRLVGYTPHWASSRVSDALVRGSFACLRSSATDSIG